MPNHLACLMLFAFSFTGIFSGCVKTPEATLIPEPVFTALDLPAHPFQSTPKLVEGKDGAVYLSWVEEHADTTARLLFSRFDAGNWTTPQRIATGSNWFLNWADFPTLAINDHMMAASFLEKSGPGTYSYDVKITLSDDYGATWSTPFAPHTDATETEHGFVSLLPLPDLRAPQFAAIWLDGRNTTGTGDHHGAMTLRSTFFDLHGNRYEEAELDVKTCDCCQTAAINIGQEEILVAYRDRSDEEIRDIATVRYTVRYSAQDDAGGWSKPKIAHHDGWKIAGCPVNGPALATIGNQVALAWFTAANDHPRVQLSLSIDKGDTFLPPVVVADSSRLGRVDVAFADQNTILVSWLEEKEANAADSNAANSNAAIMLQVVHILADNSLQTSIPILVATTSASRKSGFPQMAVGNDDVLLAWTELFEDGQTKVRSAHIQRTMLTRWKPASSF